MTIWGNHSTTQYPDLFHCEVERRQRLRGGRRPRLGRRHVHPHRRQAWGGDHRGPRVVVGGVGGQCRRRPHPLVGARHGRRRLGVDGDRVRRQLRRAGGDHLELPGDVPRRRVLDRARASTSTTTAAARSTPRPPSWSTSGRPCRSSGWCSGSAEMADGPLAHRTRTRSLGREIGRANGDFVRLRPWRARRPRAVRLGGRHAVRCWRLQTASAPTIGSRSIRRRRSGRRSARAGRSTAARPRPTRGSCMYSARAPARWRIFAHPLAADRLSRRCGWTSTGSPSCERRPSRSTSVTAPDTAGCIAPRVGGSARSRRAGVRQRVLAVLGHAAPRRLGAGDSRGSRTLLLHFRDGPTRPRRWRARRRLPATHGATRRVRAWSASSRRPVRPGSCPQNGITTDLDTFDGHDPR